MKRAPRVVILPAMRAQLASLALVALLSACSTARALVGAGPDRDPIDDLGDHHRAVATQSDVAQREFDRGLVLTFAFNHDEAIKAFERALDADPSCAMAWWGIAYCNGPHINNPMLDDEHAKRAYDTLAKAKERVQASGVERSLVDALAKRYAMPNPADRKALDLAYADAMRGVWKSWPRDADVGALFAESMMDLAPWNQWQKDGAPNPGTEEILATLDAVLALDTRHPLAHHLRIHATEASQHPELAIPSADALRELVPGAGHLVHMPAHTYARVGRWHDASESNEHGAEIDDAYRARHPDQGFYRVYIAHNRHFLAWSCMMEGRSKDAIDAARRMIADVPKEFVDANAPMIDAFLTIEIEALVRFGRWEDVLKTPEAPPTLPVTRAYRKFARAVAYAATGRIADAQRERRALDEDVARVPKDAPWSQNSAHAVLRVADRVLAGELAAQQGELVDAIRYLSDAADLEDELLYDEPPAWMIPARHSLGAVLLRAKNWPEAERTYRKDLARNPENGWALYGLARAVREQGRADEARAIEKRFAKAWEHADVKIDTSCLCLPAL